MEQNYQYHLPEKKPANNNKPPSRLGLRATTGAGAGGGEIVEVEGGHIVRSTGRKDRHSKVCTAKGPRDRRVRLSAHTAIQFYDVQDRLGYDRPSKAVDWLIKKAKASIDELAELPAWKPTNGSTPVVNLEHDRNLEKFNYHRLSRFDEHHDEDIGNNNMGHDQNSSFLPTGLDSVKSFFPASGSSESHDFNQDLKLSLHSFQPEQSNNIYFDGGGGSTWPENSGFSGFVFNSPSPSPATVTQTTPFLQPLFGQPTNNHLFNYISQRGPLQSSNNTPPVRAWVEPHPPPPPPPFSGGGVEQHPTLAFHHSPFVPGFTPGFGGLSGFHIPTRIQGDEEEHDGISDKPSSASSDSHH